MLYDSNISRMQCLNTISGVEPCVSSARVRKLLFTWVWNHLRKHWRVQLITLKDTCEQYWLTEFLLHNGRTQTYEESFFINKSFRYRRITPSKNVDNENGNPATIPCKNVWDCYEVGDVRRKVTRACGFILQLLVWIFFSSYYFARHQNYHCESQQNGGVNFDETYVECIEVLGRKVLRKCWLDISCSNGYFVRFSTSNVDISDTY